MTLLSYIENQDTKQIIKIVFKVYNSYTQEDIESYCAYIPLKKYEAIKINVGYSFQTA